MKKNDNKPIGWEEFRAFVKSHSVDEIFNHVLPIITKKQKSIRQAAILRYNDTGETYREYVTEHVNRIELGGVIKENMDLFINKILDAKTEALKKFPGARKFMVVFKNKYDDNGMSLEFLYPKIADEDDALKNAMKMAMKFAQRTKDTEKDVYLYEYFMDYSDDVVDLNNDKSYYW